MGAGTPVVASGPPTAAGPSMIDALLQRLRSAASSSELQRIAVGVLGPQCFGAGVIAGIGEDIIDSAVELAKLVGRLVLADPNDVATEDLPWWRFADPTVTARMLAGKLALVFFKEEIKQAAAERDAMLKELGQFFDNP